MPIQPNMLLEYSGWLGAFLLAICGLPQAYACWRQGHSRGLNWGFLGAWFLGEVFTLIYIIPKNDLPLLMNYCANLFLVLVIIKYKIWERPIL